MFAKINHVAIVSEKYSLLAAFYQSVFNMTTSDKHRPTRAVTVGDGYVGLNINPRKAGRPAGLDHFGVEVEGDVELSDAWRVAPDDALIARLADWLAPENVQVVY